MGRTRGGRRRCSTRSTHGGCEGHVLRAGRAGGGASGAARGRDRRRGMRWRCTGSSTCGTRSRRGRRWRATWTGRSTRSRARGIEPERWRIPWGHLADFSREIAQARQLEIVGWDADTHDWRGDDARDDARAARAPPRRDRARARRDQRRARGGRRRARRRELVPLLVAAGAGDRTRTGAAARRLADADPGRESELPSRGSASRVTALAVRDVLDEIAGQRRRARRAPRVPAPGVRRAARSGRAHAAADARGGVAPGARRLEGRRLRRADLRRPPERL